MKLFAINSSSSALLFLLAALASFSNGPSSSSTVLLVQAADDLKCEAGKSWGFLKIGCVNSTALITSSPTCLNGTMDAEAGAEETLMCADFSGDDTIKYCHECDGFNFLCSSSASKNDACGAAFGGSEPTCTADISYFGGEASCSGTKDDPYKSSLVSCEEAELVQISGGLDDEDQDFECKFCLECDGTPVCSAEDISCGDIGLKSPASTVKYAATVATVVAASAIMGVFSSVV
eukprot:CAMPEP_0119545754 /NCGR_PEP_ID=MMETSP1352-20130426/417_1 /TAXON_ID=265584 /ORGANISM="Stauroneis constricta, Strain CCMP1120" /LENGTH=233 /DNA_ID=CAMNT_0007590351 /DNA_START=104 /DNA_END=805 /DNA_ORIENTATION=+